MIFAPDYNHQQSKCHAAMRPLTFDAPSFSLALIDAQLLGRLGIFLRFCEDQPCGMLFRALTSIKHGPFSVAL